MCSSDLPNLSRHDETLTLRSWRFAHRGFYDNTTDRPENSLAAFTEAMRLGVGIEFDVQLTQDGIPVILHDTDLTRLCNTPISVANQTYESLKTYTLFDTKETIPSLQEALELIDGAVPILIEIKEADNLFALCDATAKLLKDYHGDVCIQSFNPIALCWFKYCAPTLLRGALTLSFIDSSVERLPGTSLIQLFTNFLSRPDYVAYDAETMPNLTSKGRVL